MEWPLHIRTINSGGTRMVCTRRTCNWPKFGMVDGRHRPSCTGVADLAVVSSVSVVQPRAPRTDGHATVAYLVFMTAHAYLGTMRVMYLYHYFLALVLAFCLVPSFWPRPRKDGEHCARGRIEVAVITVLLLVSFAFYSPLSFHRP